MTSLPIYFLFLSLIYTLLIFYTYFKAKGSQKDIKTALDLSACLMIGGFVGARAFHVFFEEPQFYFEHPLFSIYFWQGGFVFYGGFIAAFFTAIALVVKRNLNFLEWADFFAPIIAIGYSVGRWSCFFAGCCYGRACDFPWAVTMSWDQQRILRHPTQIYASLSELLTFVILIRMERGGLNKSAPGKIFFIWLFLHALGRIIMEYFRDDFRGQFIYGLSISTWISILLILAAGTYLLSGTNHIGKKNR